MPHFLDPFADSHSNHTDSFSKWLFAVYRISDGQMLHLQANIKYEQNDLPALKSLVDKAPAEDPATVIARGCMLFKVRIIVIIRTENAITRLVLAE